MRSVYLLWLSLSIAPFFADAVFAQSSNETGQRLKVGQAIRPPNIVVILADDCTFRDLGCYGGQAATPNIDRLASEGMKFEKCFQAAPMCSPTRHNLYTGLYPVRSGAYPNHTFAKPGTKSVAHHLKAAGYRVALSGKTHIGPRSVFPFEYSGKKNPDRDAVDQLMKECVDSEEPFCLFACSNEPHSPWDKGDASQYPPAKIALPPYLVDTPVVRKDFSDYLAEVTYFDSQVGLVLDLLEKHGQQQNTIVIVLSEQGNSFPFAKWTCYGNGLQSGMVVRWPGEIKPATLTEAMVEYVDVLPTLLDAIGVNVPVELDGKSFLPVLEGDSDRHKDFSFGLMTTRGINHGADQYAIRTVRDKRYRLIWNLNYESKFTNACTNSAAFKSMVAKARAGDTAAKELVDRYLYRPEYELYDCNNDPLEMNNLAKDLTKKPTLVRLKRELAKWMEDQGDKGIQTEQDAIMRQRRYRGLTREEALKKYENRGQ